MYNDLCKVLLIDDHPLITSAYALAFNKLSKEKKELEFEIDVARDCDSAMEKIRNSQQDRNYDFVFLDVKLPPSKNREFLSGEDIGVFLKKNFKKTKIVISTSVNDNYMVSSILKKIDPEAFLIKTDATIEVLLECVDTILLDPPYYSKSVIKLFRKQSANNLVIDDIDRQILYELSNGTKMSELPNILPLSMAALERRKRMLKEMFNVNSRGDRELLKKAHEKGVI